MLWLSEMLQNTIITIIKEEQSSVSFSNATGSTI